MIRLQDLTPKVYYKQSRDFQFIGRLFDLVLNSVKTNNDLIYSLPISDNSDSRMIDLMTMTLGFKSRHNYNIKQLTALCSAFTEVIKNKGNISSIMLAVNTLLNAEGINQVADYEISEDCTILYLFLPQELTDTNLLKDLLNYILPAGMTCNIIKEFRLDAPAITRIVTSDVTTEYYKHKDGQTDNELSILPNENELKDLARMKYENKAGILPNTSIWRPEEKKKK